MDLIALSILLFCPLLVGAGWVISQSRGVPSLGDSMDEAEPAASDTPEHGA